MDIDTLRSRRDEAKLKWWYKLASMPEDRYPKQLFSQGGNISPVEVGRGKPGVEWWMIYLLH